jgi:hypothetical protein
MLSSDGTCAWFLEIAKGGPETQYVPAELRKEVAEMLPVILPSVGLAPLRVQMKRAALTGSRRANASRLRPVTA